MLRPWFAALALVVCGLVLLATFAWSVQFDPPAMLGGLAEAAETVRLPAIAASLHVRAAEMHRAEVRRLREIGAPEMERRAARFALADRLQTAAVILYRAREPDAAGQLLREALQAAPERADLRSLLTDLNTRDLPAEERRVELLRLAYRHDRPLAHYLVAQSFLAEGRHEAAEGYLLRAAETGPTWAEPRLELARLQLRAGRAEEARESAQEALEVTNDLRTQLAAIELLRNSGGHAPERWRVIADFVIERYAVVGLLAVAFVLVLFSPALVALGARGVGAVRGAFQRSMPDNAS